VVERSPQAPAAHDRAGWVGLFSADVRIEDPVGATSEKTCEKPTPRGRLLSYGPTGSCRR
jgi:hypothetical protein